MTNNILSALTEITVQSSLLIAIVMMLRALFAKGMDKRLRYWLWLPVLLRLLVPFSVSSRLSVMNIIAPAGSVGADSVVLLPTLSAEKAAQTAAQTAPQTFPWHIVFMVVWLIGAAVIAAVSLYGNVRFSARLRNGQTAANVEIMASLCKQMGIRHIPEVYVSDGCQSPCAVGIFRPAIYLPSWAVSSPAQLRYILMHELTHIKRRDNALALLLSVCCAVYWFNPLVWVMGNAFRADCELACDAWVTKGMDSAEKTVYGMTLISALQQQSERCGYAFITGFAVRKKDMYDRIRHIKSNRPAAKCAAVCACAVMVLSLGAFGTSAKAVAPDSMNDSPAVAYIYNCIDDGVVKVSGNDVVERLSSMLIPNEDWIDLSALYIDKLYIDKQIKEYLYISIPGGTDENNARCYAVVCDDKSRYVCAAALPDEDRDMTIMKMSDESNSSFDKLIDELRETASGQ